MRLYRKIHKREMEVNLTPLIDVILLLIIFFMTVSQITQTKAEPLDLPEAEHTQEVDKEEKKRVIVTVRQNGEMVVYGEIFSVEQVHALLKEEKARQAAEDIRVLIRADGMTEWGSVERIIALCRDEGLLRVRVAVVKKE